MRALRAAAAAAAVALLRAGPALAHPVTAATAEIDVREREIDVSLAVSLLELDLLLSLDGDRDGTVGAEEIDAARPRIAEYLARRVAVSSGGTALPIEVGALAMAHRPDGRTALHAELRFAGRDPLGEVEIRCEPLAELGPDHRTLASISRDGATENVVFEPGRLQRSAAGAPARHVGELLSLGILHIFTGYDHVLFLVGLLLVGGTLREVLKIVTSFTAAHTLTLSGAALGLVTLPSRLVEVGIAASIAYVALENLLGRRLERRWLVSFGFGLVHGFGFAAALAEICPTRTGLVASLLAFNVGVELGQVAIVAAALPLLSLLRRTVAYRRVVTSASAAILAVGVFWIFERAL